jgi:multicomponent Na+:H+ antiporter subunit C
LLSHGANVFLFTVGGLSRGRPPLLNANGLDGAQQQAVDIADPLPQALLLTAIVIGFAVQAFSLVLFKRVYQATGSDDLDQLTASEPPTRLAMKTQESLP